MIWETRVKEKLNNAFTGNEKRRDISTAIRR